MLKRLRTNRKAVAPYLGDFKLLALDLDGTICNESNEIFPDIKEELERWVECGKKWVLITGRSPGDIIEVADSLPQPYGVACLNGSYIEFGDGSIRNFSIDNDIVKKCLEEDIIYGSSSRYYTISDCLATQDIPPMECTEVRVVSQDEIKSNDIFKIILDTNHKCSGELNCRKEIFRQGIRLVNRKSGKGNALYLFCKSLQIPLENTIAVGDGSTDMGMFRIAGFSTTHSKASPFLIPLSHRVYDLEERLVVETIKEFIY